MLQDLPMFLELKGYKISSLLHYVIPYNAVLIYPVRSVRTRLDYYIRKLNCSAGFESKGSP